MSCLWEKYMMLATTRIPQKICDEHVTLTKQKDYKEGETRTPLADQKWMSQANEERVERRMLVAVQDSMLRVNDKTAET